MNDIDNLMSRIDEINAKAPGELTSTDIDDIIAYHRRQRVRKASGLKAEKPKISLKEIFPELAKPAVKLARRI